MVKYQKIKKKTENLTCLISSQFVLFLVKAAAGKEACFIERSPTVNNNAYGAVHEMVMGLNLMLE